MRIAFDLDDTLSPCLHQFALEPGTFWTRVFAREQLRLGSVALIRQLIANGHEVWVYTTSFRHPVGVRLLFWAHGIRISGFVNAKHHERVVSRSGQSFSRASKYPPAFGIDVLVDDLDGVAIEANTYGFRAIVVQPDDACWTDSLMNALG